MKTMTRSLAMAGLVAVLATGCATSGNVAIKDQTQQSIDSVIVKSKTTKQEVLNRFGAADSVSFTDSGNEIWTYRHSRSKPMARNFIPYNVFSLGDNVKTKELVILFNANGVVSNYTFRETDNQAKFGIAQ
ncbi:MULTISPECIES: hypothetical protein [Moraxella]|uniref:Lipoprotein SmpA/OmlA domain-containing protein n=1 Tax=Moraxella nasicaprae TaxID=2904122 RepID=A0ABY6F2G3_9GAMM|nr:MULTISPECIES: hypothetical protein [Moraxella]MDO4894935.1 hypothetical protein [Moraxella sp.]UXZ04278.1 hypothetical protein LU297_06635 [Moraxella nasicaprae]